MNKNSYRKELNKTKCSGIDKKSSFRCTLCARADGQTPSPQPAGRDRANIAWPDWQFLKKARTERLPSRFEKVFAIENKIQEHARTVAGVNLSPDEVHYSEPCGTRVREKRISRKTLL